MKLFDDIIRTDQRSKRENESLFDYINLSGRASVASIRELLECWFDKFPEDDKSHKDAKSQIRGRFRSPIDFQHQGAFFEIYLHELLLSMGFDIDLEPKMGGGTSTHPDFKILINGQPQFYLEATLAAQSEAEAADNARMAEVFDVINRINSPNFLLSLSYRGVPSSSRSTKRLCQELELWLSSLNPDEVARTAEQAGLDQLPLREWMHGDWNLTFTAFPKSPEYRGQEGPIIGVIAPLGTDEIEAYEVKTHESVRSAVRKKATKYKDLDLPYVVAVNIIEPFANQIDVFNALFGLEQITVSLPNWVENKTRMPNGAWFGPKGPQNKRVSAVLIECNLTPRLSATRTPEMIHNPWASLPLSSDIWPLPQLLIDLDKNRLEKITGKAAKDFLSFPDLWPLAED